MSTTFNVIRFASSCIVATAMLAACSGSQMGGTSAGVTPQSQSASSLQRAAMGSPAGVFSPADCGGGNSQGLGAGSPADRERGCCGQGDGGSSQGANGLNNNDGDGNGHRHCIRVTPHNVTFTSSNSGPVTVTVHVRGHRNGTVSEQDNCGGSNGIATLTQGTSNQWTVTAGSQTGSCRAVFTLKDQNGQTVDRTRLHITNTI